MRIDGLPDDNGCTIIGRASSEAIETPLGRFMPVDVETMRPEGFSKGTGAVQSEWEAQSGVVMVRVRRDFVGLSGARFRMSGILASDPDSLHEPVILRYRPRALLLPRTTGVPLEQIDDPAAVQRSLNWLRYRLMSHLSWGLDESQGELVAGITFGRRGRRIEGNWASDFYKAGLSHLIVASGSQVSLLFMPVFFILGRVRLSIYLKWTLLFLMGTALIGFAKLLGGEPSILRAAAMGCILLVSIGVGRQAYGLATLSASGWFWLLQNPLLARDISFLLSMGASFGIIYFGPPIFETCLPQRERIRDRISFPRQIAGFFMTILRRSLQFIMTCSLITLSAQLGVLPVLASTIGRIPLFGVIANLFAVPLGQFVLFLGALSGIMGFICPTISLILNKVLSVLAAALMTVAGDFAGLPGANTLITPLPGWVVIAYYALCVFLVEKSKAFPVNVAPAGKPGESHDQGGGILISLAGHLPKDIG
jgi:competence protein ComEC